MAIPAAMARVGRIDLYALSACLQAEFRFQNLVPKGVSQAPDFQAISTRLTALRCGSEMGGTFILQGLDLSSLADS